MCGSAFNNSYIAIRVWMLIIWFTKNVRKQSLKGKEKVCLGMRGEVKRTKSSSFILKSQLVIFKTKKIKKCQYKASYSDM